MSQIVSNEVPSWAIDWSNKTFTTVNGMLSVVSLSIDGAEYYSYTFSWSTLTLTDAPTVSIRVDYIGVWSSSNPALNIVTLRDLLVATYKVLWEPSDSLNYEETDVATPVINRIVDQICKWVYINPSNEKRYQSGDLPFLRRDHFVQWVKPLGIGGAITTTSTEIDVATSTYATSGSVLVGNDIIDYNNKSSTQLLEVNNIGIGHNAGEKVYQLYPLPSWISLPFTVFQLGSSGEREYEIPFNDYRYPAESSINFTIITKVDGTNLLHVVWVGDKRIQLVYYANSTDMTEPASTCSIPDDFSMNIIPSLAAWEILRDNEELDDAVGKLNKWCYKLDAMYSYYSKMIKRSRSTIKVRNSGFSWLWFPNGKRRPDRYFW